MVERYIPQRPTPAPYHQSNGKFAPGNPGKPVGSASSKLTRTIQEQLMAALETAGAIEAKYVSQVIKQAKGDKALVKYRLQYKVSGRGGAIGYFHWLAANRPELFSQLIGKMMPTLVAAKISASGSVDHTGQVEHVHTLVPPERMRDMSLDELASAYRDAVTAPKLALVDNRKDEAA